MAQQYLITAYDFTDSEALARRMAVRPSHFDAIKKFKATGNFIVGGAILSPQGTMIGSSLIMQFENEAEVQQWLNQEPYYVQKIWDKIEIKLFRVADI